jgi:hypothetical protein
MSALTAHALKIVAAVDRRCIYDMTTDPTVAAIVGVYSSGRAAACTICQLHHGSN